MRWRKMGRIFVPDGRLWWAKKYAFPPTPHFRADGTLRMFVACCDEHTVGRIGYVDLDPDDPARVLGISSEPVLDIGMPGAFDENGLLPTVAVPDGNRLLLYYVGYQLGYKVRYFQFQGLAVSTDDGTSFTRVQRVPVIDRSDTELVNRTSAFVMRERQRFRMWYVGGSEWVQGFDKYLPVYNLRYLESADGVTWGPAGEVCIDFQNADEHAFGRPWVVRQEAGYRMFFSVRTKSTGYRLTYADSRDGRHWERKSDIGLDVSSSGWDSQMVAYASVVSRKERTYLFYNGNNCGETGFGYAVLEAW